MKPSSAWLVPAGIVVGGLSAFGVLLGPATGVTTGDGALLPAILPLGFYAAGALAAILLPGQAVGYRLLAVGTLHLAAIALGIVATAIESAALAWPLAVVAAGLYNLGFVALYEALARYPDGAYAFRVARPVALAGAAAAVALAVLSALGSPSLLVVVEAEAARPNPFQVTSLAPLISVGRVLPALVPLGLILLLARYRIALADSRAQMRWPIGTAAAVVIGILSTGLLQEQLGQAGQAAIFIVAASALPASFLIGLLQRAREAERFAALEASRSRIATAGVEERRRIERDLHDGAQQHLVALLARVELARSEADPGSRLERELTEIGASIRDVHSELRELARGIYPAILTDQGLGAAVASAIGRLPIQAAVEIAPEVDRHRFPAPIEGAAYLFVLEGLTNVMKHSGAERADVRLSRDGASLRVMVRDDGRGFDPALLGPTALQALRDRLGAVGGEFHLQSRPGVGTQLVGVFPVG